MHTLPPTIRTPALLQNLCFPAVKHHESPQALTWRQRMQVQVAVCLSGAPVVSRSAAQDPGLPAFRLAALIMPATGRFIEIDVVYK